MHSVNDWQHDYLACKLFDANFEGSAGSLHSQKLVEGLFNVQVGVKQILKNFFHLLR